MQGRIFKTFYDCASLLIFLLVRYMITVMEKICLIISGGDYADIPEEIKKASYYIACDRGWQYADKMRITPDLIIGDFDSSPEPEGSVPVMRFPSHKDDTDTMIAARHALSLGFTDIAICCAFGGRLDHTVANIQTAAFLVSNGASVRLYGHDSFAYVFSHGEICLPKMASCSLSLFSLSDRCTGVSVLGSEYEAGDLTLTNSFPLGVSNAWASSEARISVDSGILMILCSKIP